MKKFLLALCAVLLLAGSAMANTYGYWYGEGPIIIPGSPWQPINPRNESFIIQKGMLSYAMVTQVGDQSKSYIYQDTKRGRDFAVVYQQSYCCTMGGCHCGFSWYGISIPILTGDSYQNQSKIKQTGWGWHDAYVTQVGDGNESKITQRGKNDKATVVQRGAFNESEIDQSGWKDNEAFVTQLGELNKSYIRQEDGDNYAKVRQNGFGNLSAIFQDSNCFGHNTALVNQVGYMNYSAICQTGSGCHTATVNQYNNCYNAGVIYCGANGVVGLLR